MPYFAPCSKRPICSSNLCYSQRWVDVQRKTIYNYIDACLFDVRILIPSQGKVRERYKKPEFKVDKGCRIGRNYDDFNVFLDKTPIFQSSRWTRNRQQGWEMPLTIHFVDTSLMLAFIRCKYSQSVIDIFNTLEDDIGTKHSRGCFQSFLRQWQWILKSKSNWIRSWKIWQIENQDILLRCRTPLSKRRHEVNHELIRESFQGNQLNHLEQGDISLMMNHINSYKEKNWTTVHPTKRSAFTTEKRFCINLMLTGSQWYHVKTRSSQNIVWTVPPTISQISSNRGRFSDYKKIERELTSSWHAVFYYHTTERA